MMKNESISLQEWASRMLALGNEYNDARVRIKTVELMEDCENKKAMLLEA